MRTRTLAVVTVFLLLAVATSAAAHVNHDLKFVCDDPSPSTASSNADFRCSFQTQNASEIWLDLPVDAEINEVGTHDGADPANGAKVGSVTVATDLSYNGCGGGQNDGGTYGIYWRSQPNWTTYSAPPGWTKTAEFRVEFVVLFFFTEQVPIHVVKNNTTGQYRLVLLPPSSRICAGAITNWDLTIYAYAGQNSANAWVYRNPSTAGNKTVDLTVIDTGANAHTDSDTITIT